MGDQQKQLVKGMYEAFARGDVEAVIGAMTDDVVWDVPGAAPFAGRRFGRDHVRQFFGTLDQTVRLDQFDVDEFLADRDKVVALGKLRATVRPTGSQYETRWAHVYTVRGDKVSEVYLFADTHAEASAMGESTRERQAMTGPMGVSHPAFSGRTDR